MIQAAVYAAKGKGEPPPLLVLVWNCQKWATLPRAGGMGDQSFVEIWRMNVLANVYYTAKAWFSGDRLTKDQEKYFIWLIEEYEGFK